MAHHLCKWGRSTFRARLIRGSVESGLVSLLSGLYHSSRGVGSGWWAFVPDLAWSIGSIPLMLRDSQQELLLLDE